MVLLALNAAMLFLPRVHRYLMPPTIFSIQQTDTIWKAFQQLNSSRPPDGPQDTHPWKENKSSPVRGPLFYFDPNTLSPVGWKSLGLFDKTISTIQHYLSKGGHFKHAGDLSRIYGLSHNLATQLMPYVRIQQSSSTPFAFPKQSSYPRATSSKIDVNIADSLAWESLPGIGRGLSARIVKFRNQLGGFWDIQQLKEVYGLSDSVFKSLQHRLIIGHVNIQRLLINSVDQTTLQRHPYIRYSMARAIVRYREQHGPFGRVEDIRKAFLMPDSIFQKLQPYLTTE